MDDPLLIFSTTRKDADLRYLLGTHIPDDIAVLYHAGRTTVLASALEINRLRGNTNLYELVAWEDIKLSLPLAKPTDYDIIKGFLEKIGHRKIVVKRDFPVYLADRLRQDGYKVTISDFTILPQRMIKSDEEISEITHCAKITQKTFAEAKKILSASSVRDDGVLLFEGEVLSSERLRDLMENFCYQLGGVANNSIVAGGIGACDPHNIGYGPLKANELLVIDFFPQLKASGYYSDVSRTFIKGKPSNKQTKLYNAVKYTHDLAIAMVGDGVAVTDIMSSVFLYFDSVGYPSDKRADPPHGMIHGLGHGLGLDIHEPPRVGICEDILRSGMVITIEPGLYYREIGGVRIEDDILVEKNRGDIITHIPYDWIIE